MPKGHLTKKQRGIWSYIQKHPEDNCDLCTLLHEMGEDDFLKVIRAANGRRIILYHKLADKYKCDPPIYWRYTRQL